ncbi:MAG: GTP pyrophosphokinase family protein [Agathobacter sp.]|nr:GTP pyrophosphokinase family protein [Agathobacter sp.]
MYVNSIIEQKREQFVRQNFLSDEFLEFVKRNSIPFETLISYYRCAIMEVETKFKVLDEQYALRYDRNPIESIKSRVKSSDSLLKKIRKKDIPLTLEAIEENIWDIAGIRVICSYQDDIYLLAECLLQQDDVKLIEVKDYIKNPKANGYRSLHLIVEVPIFLQEEKRNMKVEVQLRTIAMDFWASLEHKLRYKKNLSEEQIAELSNQLEECAQISADLDMRMQNIRSCIYKDGTPTKYEDMPLIMPVFGQAKRATLFGLLGDGRES